MEHQQTTINCRGHLLDLSRVRIMGILNLTPDSFFDGGRYGSETAVLKQVEKMLEEGMDILDVGGMSSRPGSDLISPAEEQERIMPALAQLRREFPELLISVDTIRSEVARAALDTGVHLINDISAGRFDANLIPTVAEYGVPYVLMHMQGKPSDMQRQPAYADVLIEVYDFLAERLAYCRETGIRDVILDPGFGFGKTVAHNYRLLDKLHFFQSLEAPILAGISRKSMICKVLRINPKDALNGTTALHMIALEGGARLLRVHDVREARQAIQLWQQLETVRTDI